MGERNSCSGRKEVDFMDCACRHPPFVEWERVDEKGSVRSSGEQFSICKKVVGIRHADYLTMD